MNEYLYIPLKMMSVKNGKIQIRTILQAEVYARYQNIYKPETRDEEPQYYRDIAKKLEEIDCSRVAAKCLTRAYLIEVNNISEYETQYLNKRLKELLPILKVNKYNNVIKRILEITSNEIFFLGMTLISNYKCEVYKYNKGVNSRANSHYFLAQDNSSEFIHWSKNDEIIKTLDYYSVAKNNDGKYGYKNPFGEWAIDPIYDWVDENMHIYGTSAKKDGKYGYLDTRGEVVIEFIYDQMSQFNNYGSYSRISLNNRNGLLDLFGNVIWEDEL